MSWWVGGFDGKWRSKKHQKSTEIDHFGTIGSDFRNCWEVLSQLGVTYWAECRALLWHIGQSVAAYCRILGRVSWPAVTYWAECRSWVWHAGQRVVAWRDILGRVSHLTVAY